MTGGAVWVELIKGVAGTGANPDPKKRPTSSTPPQASTHGTADLLPALLKPSAKPVMPPIRTPRTSHATVGLVMPIAMSPWARNSIAISIVNPAYARPKKIPVTTTPINHITRAMTIKAPMQPPHSSIRGALPPEPPPAGVD